MGCEVETVRMNATNPKFEYENKDASLNNPKTSQFDEISPRGTV